MVRHLNKVETYLERQAAVPEFATMSRMEERLERAAFGEWSERANAVIASTLSAAPSTLTDAYLESVPSRLIRGFGVWPSEDLDGLTREVVDETYRLSAQVILRKHEGAEGYQRELVFRQEGDTAGIVPTFTTPDEDAIAYLGESQVFWMREHFDTDTVTSIRAAGWTELSGLSGRRAGEKLRKLAERQFGVGAFALGGRSYFEGVAVNAATTARVVGGMFQMRDLGIQEYVFVSVLDERTTPVCEHMDGKRFPVDASAARMDTIVESGDPQAIRDLHPWRPDSFRDDLAALGVDLRPGVALSGNDAATVVNAGFAFPPLHFRCRSTVDIA